MRNAALSVGVAHALQALSFCTERERTAAGRAFDQSVQHIRRGDLRMGIPWLLHRQKRLHTRKDGAVDDRLVHAVGDHDRRVVKVAAGFARRIPADLAGVNGIAQHIRHRAVLPAVAPCGENVFAVQPARDLHHRHAVQIIGKNAFDDRRRLRIDDILLVLDGIAVCRSRDRAAALHAFGHAALYLARKPDRIVFIRPLDDPFNQRAERSLRHRLRNAAHLHAVPAQHGLVKNALLLIAREPRKFPQQHRAERRRFLLGSGDHPVKGRPLVGASAADAVVAEDKRLGQSVAVLFGVGAHHLYLAVGRELCLAARGHADIGGGCLFLVHSQHLGLSYGRCETYIM